MPPIVTDGHLDPGTASARRFPFAAAIAALLVFLASAASVAAFWGGARLLTPTALTADVRLDPLVLPAGLALDPKIVADQLRQQLTAEADRDVAVRLTIGADNVKKLNEMIFLRLIGPNTIKRLIDRVAPLKAVLSLGQFRTTARVSVANAGSVPLEDVAMTLPGVLLAETPDGTALEVHVPQQGPAAVRIGRLEPGAQFSFAAWTTDAADQPGTAGAIRLGAAGGTEGIVSLYGAEGWLGEELAVRPGPAGWSGACRRSFACRLRGTGADRRRRTERPAALRHG